MQIGWRNTSPIVYHTYRVCRFSHWWSRLLMKALKWLELEMFRALWWLNKQLSVVIPTPMVHTHTLRCQFSCANQLTRALKWSKFRMGCLANHAASFAVMQPAFQIQNRLFEHTTVLNLAHWRLEVVLALLRLSLEKHWAAAASISVHRGCSFKPATGPHWCLATVLGMDYTGS